MELVPVLRRLTEAVGLSGYEASIRQEVESTWAPFLDEIRVDRLGNLIGLKQGAGAEPRRKLMLASHMDEIGLMVTKIDQGFLHVTEVGGLDQRLLLVQPVTVHGKRDLPGVIGSRPPHVLTAGERSQLVPWDKLLVDVSRFVKCFVLSPPLLEQRFPDKAYPVAVYPGTPQSDNDIARNNPLAINYIVLLNLSDTITVDVVQCVHQLRNICSFSPDQRTIRLFDTFIQTLLQLIQQFRC